MRQIVMLVNLVNDRGIPLEHLRGTGKLIRVGVSWMIFLHQPCYFRIHWVAFDCNWSGYAEISHYDFGGYRP